MDQTNTRPTETRALIVQIGRRLLLLLAAWLLAQLAWYQGRAFILLAELTSTVGGRQPAGPAAGDDRLWERSLVSRQPVAELIERAGISGQLIAWTLGLALVIGLMGAALLVALRVVERRQGWVGRVATGLVASLGLGLVAMPVISLASGLIVHLAVSQRLLPAGGLGPAGGVGLVLPLITLTVLPAAVVAASANDDWRCGRWEAGLGGVLAGLGRTLVMLIALLPVVESIFALPGVGRLTIAALLQRDLPVVSVGLLLALQLAAVGTALAVVGDGLAHWLAARSGYQGAPAAELTTAPAGRWPWLGLVGLVVPLALLALTIPVGLDDALHSGLDQRLAAPSATLPWGGDELGRDLYSRSLLGLRWALLLMAGAAIVALIGGLIWGGIARLVASWQGEIGRTVADLLLGPAWLLSLPPLLPAALAVRLFLRESQLLGFIVIFGFLLTPRLALLVRDLGELNQPWRWSVEGRQLIGLALLAAGGCWLASINLDALGLGTAPPTATLGLVQIDLLRSIASSRWLGAIDNLLWLEVLAATPVLLAGCWLLRGARRGRALGLLLG